MGLLAPGETDDTCHRGGDQDEKQPANDLTGSTRIVFLPVADNRNERTHIHEAETAKSHERKNGGDNLHEGLYIFKKGFDFGSQSVHSLTPSQVLQ